MQLFVWISVIGQNNGPINTWDWLVYYILDTKNNGNYLGSFTVTEFVDGDSYSTLFALQYLMGLDLISKTVLAS